MTTNGYVLIVDDDIDIGDTIELVLQSSGIDCRVAHDGSEALEQLQQDPLPSVVLLDAMMPEMTGAEFRDRQLHDPRIAGVPVVLMTGDARAAEKAAELGIARWLRKPVTINQLLAAIRASQDVS